MIRTYYFGLAYNIWKGKNIVLPTNKKDDNSEDKSPPDADISFDREAFWVACVLHDIGVSPDLTPPPPAINKDEIITPETNFEVRGASKAHEFVTSADLQPKPFDAKRAWLVHEAIALHTSTVRHGERNATQGLQWAAMLFDGAATDLTAMKLGKISEATCKVILSKHPKLDLHQAFPQMLRKECTDRPCCLIAQTGKIGLFEIMEQSESRFDKYK